jgi:hypothetical protein
MAREEAQTQSRESKKRCPKYKRIIKNGEFYMTISIGSVQNKNRIYVMTPLGDIEIE